MLFVGGLLAIVAFGPELKRQHVLLEDAQLAFELRALGVEVEFLALDDLDDLRLTRVVVEEVGRAHLIEALILRQKP